jgi:hypothetical protein
MPTRDVCSTDQRDAYTVVVGKLEKWEHFGLVGINRRIIKKTRTWKSEND